MAFIIEDDVLYCPPSHRRSPLVAIAPDINAVGSFSKYFAGGLRLGFIILPPLPLRIYCNVRYEPVVYY